MTGAAARWFYAVTTLVGLGSTTAACDRRFQFDTEASVGGAGGAPSFTAGSSGSGSSSASGGGGGNAGSATAGTGGQEAGSSAGGAAGSGGAPPTGCGTLGECLEGMHCADGQCVQCAFDSDCAAYDLPRCELTRHRCVACLTTADCQPGFACDSLASRCLRICVDDDTCPASAHGCDERRQVCYQCDEDRECATAATGHLCASDGSGCVECRKETDCPSQHCDQLTGRCVACRDGRDCPSQICSAATFTCAP